MRFVPVLATLAVSTSIAVASPDSESPTTTEAETQTRVPIALAINTPLMWADGRSIAVSGYVGINAHHGIRANVASYKHDPMLAADVFSGLLFGAESEASYFGRTTDISVGWQYFPRSLWNGFNVELGLMRRSQDIRERDAYATPYDIATKATGYAARGMIGWSWLGWNRVFLATAIGASVGRYAGTETSAESDYMPVYMQKDFTRMQGGVEAYLRFGIVLGR